MKKNIKKAAVAGAALLTLLLLVLLDWQSSQAATTIGVGQGTPLLSSANTALTNAHTGFNTTTTNPWPVAIIGGDAVTNFTTIDTSGGKDTAIEFTASISVANGAALNQNAILHIYRNVEGGTATNSMGSPLHYEQVALLTLSIPASSSAGAYFTVCTNLSSVLGQDGAFPNMWAGYIDCGALTNITYLTNYSVWVRNQ